MKNFILISFLSSIMAFSASASSILTTTCISADKKFKLEFDYGSYFFWIIEGSISFTEDGLLKKLPMSSIKQYKNNGHELFIQISDDELKWAYKIEAKNSKGILIGENKGDKTKAIHLSCIMEHQ